MHRMYVEECRSDHIPPVSYRSYKLTFLFRIILIWGSALLGVIHAPNVINYPLGVTNSICTKKKPDAVYSEQSNDSELCNI